MFFSGTDPVSSLLPDIYDRLYSAFGPQHWWPGDTPFEVAVGAVLTQNTNWGNVERAIANLKRERALSAKRIHSMSPGELAELIRPAGYFNVKSMRLKSFVAFLSDRYGRSMARMARGSLPGLRDDLLGVHGVGEETADSILLYALEKPVFVIDAYTRRILSRHGILDQGESYQAFQHLFHDQWPPDGAANGGLVAFFNEYHALLVRLGKDFCRPRNPRCPACPLENISLRRKI